MDTNSRYSGSLTSEQFLFHEMRIVAELYMQRHPIEEIVRMVKQNNLFQYPTERKIPRLARACCRRLQALGSERLIHALTAAPVDDAKQVNLYAMICYNRIVREFMIHVIGEKFRLRDYSFSKKDLNIFFSRLQEQHDDVAAWSEKTVAKLKQVLTKAMVETDMLDGVRAANLNPVFICEELESGIRENGDFAALAAFNCFRR